MTDQISKHPNYNNELLPENNDLFKPDFRRDSRGRYFMQLPGYGKWMVSNEPGSKIIAQGSEDESGGAATDPASIRTGSLSVETTIYIGDSIYMDGGTGCIIIGDILKLALTMCKDGIKGLSDQSEVFAFLLQQQTWEWRAGEKADKGDVLIGSIVNDEYVYWNNDEGKLYIKGDLVIEGDIVSAGYPTPPYYWLDYSEGDIEISGELRASNVTITGGDVDNIILTGLLAGSEPSIQGWSHDMIFTATDYNTIAWTAGTIYLTDGTTYSVSSGSMDMTTDDPFYIYYSGSSTLSVSDDPNDAVGSGKILICVCKRNSDTGKLAVFQVFGNEGQGVFITADDIAANTITANEIFANTITANEIAGNTITANQIASLYFTGKVAEFDLGVIGGWVISSQCLTKDKDIGSNRSTRIQLCIGAGTDAGHLQAGFLHDNSYGWTHPNAPIDLIQLTQGEPGDDYTAPGKPNPRLDIYRATGTVSRKRVMLNAYGLHFYDQNQNPVGTITGNNAGSQTNFDIPDISIANNTVRILSTGVRVIRGAAFSAADGLGLYFQLYVDNSFDGTFGYQNVLSMSTSAYLKIENSGGGFVARFSGVPGGSYALHLAGALRLGLVSGMARPTGQHGVVYYDDGTGDASRQGNFYGYDGYTASWVTLSGSGLPSGSSYDMMRSNGGTNWVSTADVYWGSSSSYHLYRDPGTNDTHLNIPSGRDYAFQVGGSYRFVIFSSGLVWTNGTIQAYDTFEFGAGGDIYSNGSRFYFNRESYFWSSIRTYQNLIVDGSITVFGTTFLPFTVAGTGGNIDGKRVLAN